MPNKCFDFFLTLIAPVCFIVCVMIHPHFTYILYTLIYMYIFCMITFYTDSLMDRYLLYKLSVTISLTFTIVNYWFLSSRFNKRRMILLWLNMQCAEGQSIFIMLWFKGGFTVCILSHNSYNYFRWQHLKWRQMNETKDTCIFCHTVIGS